MINGHIYDTTIYLLFTYTFFFSFSAILSLSFEKTFSSSPLQLTQRRPFTNVILLTLQVADLNLSRRCRSRSDLFFGGGSEFQQVTAVEDGMVIVVEKSNLNGGRWSWRRRCVVGAWWRGWWVVSGVWWEGGGGCSERQREVEEKIMPLKLKKPLISTCNINYAIKFWWKLQD